MQEILFADVQLGDGSVIPAEPFNITRIMRLDAGYEDFESLRVSPYIKGKSDAGTDDGSHLDDSSSQRFDSGRPDSSMLSRRWGGL